MTDWILLDGNGWMNSAFVARVRTIKTEGGTGFTHELLGPNGALLGLAKSPIPDREQIIPAPPGWMICSFWFDDEVPLDETPLPTLEPLIAFRLEGTGEFSSITLIGLTFGQLEMGINQGGDYFVYPRDPSGIYWLADADGTPKPAQTTAQVIEHCYTLGAKRAVPPAEPT